MRAAAAGEGNGGAAHLSEKKLPNYDVFDEARYFRPGDSPHLISIDGRNLALTICEDAWNDKQFWERRRYTRDPVEELAQAGARRF